MKHYLFAYEELLRCLPLPCNNSSLHGKVTREPFKRRPRSGKPDCALEKACDSLPEGGSSQASGRDFDPGWRSINGLAAL